MESIQYFFAVDLGATSGRTIIGSLRDGRISLEELTRFDNNIIETCGHLYWDIYFLYNEIIKGLKLVAQRNIKIKSIGIDTWGCDFVFIDKDGEILKNPIAYRDPHTLGMMEKYFNECISKKDVYEKTGIQFMNFNSLFQLYTLQKAGNIALKNAKKVLFIPDALNYMLTGKIACEYTIASTTQLLNPNIGDLDEDIIKSIGMSRDQFGKIIMPGTIIGKLTDNIQKITGLGSIPVVAVAGHDTGSAVAAVPAKDRHFAYLSSGTWSLMGIETKKAIINKHSFNFNFTNEGGIEGTTRFLKNICGMWIYERCRKEWPTAPKSHTQLQKEASMQPAFRSLINPDDECFVNPALMVNAIQDYCKRNNQPIPIGYAAISRCIFDSLALRYRQIFMWLKDFADFDINTLHIIGGGSQNDYLNQFTANACNVTVLAGPKEATAIGNIMLQAKTSKMVKDIWGMRKIIANSIDLKCFEPHETKIWDTAYEKFLTITQ